MLGSSNNTDGNSEDRESGRDSFESCHLKMYNESLYAKEGADVSAFSDEELCSLVNSDLACSHISADEQQCAYMVDEDYGTLIHNVERFVAIAVKSKGDAVTVGEIDGRRQVLGETRLSRYRYKISRALDCFVPEYHYGPAVTLFYDIAHRLGVTELFRGNWNLPLGENRLGLGDDAIIADLFIYFVHQLRHQYRARRIDRKISRRKEYTKANLESGSAYFKWLVGRYSKLMVVRIDLAFKRELVRDITIHEAIKCFDIFLRSSRRKRSIFRHSIGYIAKLEYSRLKGYHYHLILFFNGQFVMAHAYHGEQVGKYWRDDVTAGKGTYYNCNRHANRYKRCGIGVILSSDSVKQDNLLYALGYLAKSEQMVEVKTKKGQRTFFRGQPRERKSSAGRPRVGSSGMSQK